METTLRRLDVEDPPAERMRLTEGGRAWRRFRPYLADRQWGSMREDCLPNGEA